MTKKISENEKIDPKDIKFTDDVETSVEISDEDMPQQETKDYNKTEDDTKSEKATTEQTFVKPTELFISLFAECMGKLPYATVLTNQNGDSIKLSDLVRFIEAKTDKMAADQMNKVLSFIASAPFSVVRPLMDIVENSERHAELWSFVK